MPGIREMNRGVSSTAARILDRERFLPRKPRESTITYRARHLLTGARRLCSMGTYPILFTMKTESGAESR